MIGVPHENGRRADESLDYGLSPAGRRREREAIFAGARGAAPGSVVSG